MLSSSLSALQLKASAGILKSKLKSIQGQLKDYTLKVLTTGAMPQRHSLQPSSACYQGSYDPSFKRGSTSCSSDSTDTLRSTAESASNSYMIPLYHPIALNEIQEPLGQRICNKTTQYFPDYGSHNEVYHDTWLDTASEHYVLRLFNSIEGYHKGSLDLAGRHPQRYYALQVQWNRFLYEFTSLDICRQEGDELSSAMLVSYGNEVDWFRFREKWGFPCRAKYNDARDATQQVMTLLKLHPEPTFQALCLLDLPSELLDLIFRFTSTSDAIALSCTCHLLNNVGRRRIFRRRKLGLHLSPDILMHNLEYSEIDLPTIAHYAKDELLKDLCFLLGCPVVRSQIQSLLITDEWWPRGRVLLPGNDNHRNPYLLDEKFYQPIYEHFLIAVRCIPRLTELTLCNLNVTRDLLISLSATPTLNTLSLEYCRVPTIVQACILLNRLPTSSSLANLNILIDPDAEETRTQWYTLILFPRIRTLSVGGVGQAGVPLPDYNIRGRCHLYNLERLALQDLDAGDISSLSLWLHSIGSISGLRLTHFKLHSSWGILDADIMNLMKLLEDAPLEVLALEGLANAEPELFDCISALFPQLVALTLIRRQNSYQFENRAVVWPHASWEYAQCLKGFARLQHFCWNFSMVYYDATPAALLALESDFMTADDDGVEEQPSYFIDSQCTALPFAAYCPSLETFAITGRVIDMACYVTRNRFTGAVMLKAALPPHSSTSAWNIEQWNTVDCRWPPLTSPELGKYT